MEGIITVAYNYEKSMEINKKKQLGAFYTDYKLASYIVKNLNINSTDKVIDPACGGCVFINALRDYLGKEFNINNVFGIDIDKSVIKIIQGELANNNNFDIVKKNFICADSINKKTSIEIKNGKEYFDYVIGNPPYVTGKNGINYNENAFNYNEYINGNVNLSMLMLIRAFDLLKVGGVVAYILPKNLLYVDAYEKLRVKLLTEYSILEIVNLGLYFKDVRGEQIVLFVKKEAPSDNHKIKVRFLKNKKDFVFEDVEIYQKDFRYNNKIILLKNKNEIEIIRKMDLIDLKLESLVDGNIVRGMAFDLKEDNYNAYRGRDIKKFGVKKSIKGIPKMTSNYYQKINLLQNKKVILQNIFSAESGIIASYTDENYLTTETVTNIIFNKEDDAKYILGLLNSRLLNYYLIFAVYNNSKVTMHTDRKYIGCLPIVVNDDKKKEVVSLVNDALSNSQDGSKIKEILKKLDCIVYSIYGLKNDQISLIENNLREVLSKEWW